MIELTSWMSVESLAKQNKLAWPDVAAIFDRSGSVYVGHRIRKGNRYRLRFSSSNKELLSSLLEFFDSGTLYCEHRSRGPYYRFEIVGRDAILDALEHILPYLSRRKSMAEEWIRDLGQLRIPF